MSKIKGRCGTAFDGVGTMVHLRVEVRGAEMQHSQVGGSINQLSATRELAILTELVMSFRVERLSIGAVHCSQLLSEIFPKFCALADPATVSWPRYCAFC
jgi:hypothetical protein